MKLLFLYTRLPIYFYKCVEYLINNNTSLSCEIYVLDEDMNAPYLFTKEGEKLQVKKNHQFFDRIQSASYDLVYVAGWRNKQYRKIARQHINKGVPVICGLDNPWVNSIKNRIKGILLKPFLHRYFSHIWVAGERQRLFAHKLGYPDSRILDGLYVGNFEDYSITEQELELKKNNYPKKLVYFGRLVEYKNIIPLAKAFQTIPAEERNGWQLYIYGNGPLEYDLKSIVDQDVFIQGFVQPNDLGKIVKNSGCFVLLSDLEHWGVAVHEATIAGLPLLLSQGVVSGDTFLENGKNGFMVKTEPEAIQEALYRIFNLSENALLQMSKISVERSNKLNYNYWIAQLLSTIK